MSLPFKEEYVQNWGNHKTCTKSICKGRVIGRDSLQQIMFPAGLPRIAPLVVAHKGPACTAAFAETAGEKVLDLLLECFT